MGDCHMGGQGDAPGKGSGGWDKTAYHCLSLSGLKVPTTITLTLRGQPSRITTLSPVGTGAAPSEEPASQVLPSNSQVSLSGETEDMGPALGGGAQLAGWLGSWAGWQARCTSTLGVCGFVTAVGFWVLSFRSRAGVQCVRFRRTAPSVVPFFRSFSLLGC